MSAEEKLGALAIESQEKDEQEVVADAVPVDYSSAEDKEVATTPPRIARFEKVSFETFLESYKPNWIAMQKQLQNVPEERLLGMIVSSLKKIQERSGRLFSSREDQQLILLDTISFSIWSYGDSGWCVYYGSYRNQSIYRSVLGACRSSEIWSWNDL